MFAEIAKKSGVTHVCIKRIMTPEDFVITGYASAFEVVLFL